MSKLKTKTTTTEMIETVLPEVVVSEVKRLGRPVNENSVRQIRLKELEMKRANGELKKGRPVLKDSVRQIRLKELEIKKANGELRRGRPVNENSVRQIKLKNFEIKRANGELRRGRPKMNVVVEVVAE
jgi:hypothetical protein